LEHVFTISDASIERANDLGLNLTVHQVAMNQPSSLQPPIRKIQDSGILWGLGTDASIVSAYQPCITLGWVTTGKSINGQVINEEPVTREEALIAHTRSNAYILHKDEDIGTLEAGKLADLVVLDRDYMTVPVDEIFNIQPLMTMVGGRVVYNAL
jgi:predicted amidohydrolase YtcJ